MLGGDLRARRRRRRAPLRGRASRSPSSSSSRRRARRPRLGDRDRHRVGRRALRAGGHGRAAVDARQPAGALHRPLRALRRRDRRRADVDPRLAVRERAARARARDRRGRARAEDGVMRFQRAAAERHGDAAAARRLHHRRCSGSRTRSATGRASTRSRSRSIGARLPARRLRGVALGVPAHARRREPAIEQRAHADLPLRPAIALLAVAGVGAAFVSDWFVDALDPAVEALGISKAFTGLVIVAIAGNAVENVVGVTLAAKGTVRPRDLGRQELGRADRRLPLPGARPALAASSTPADVRAQPGLHRRARADGDRGLADHRRRRGGRCSRAGARRRSTSSSAVLTWYE